MNSVFLLQHLHTLPSGVDDVKIIGIYSTKDAALAAISRVKLQNGFNDFPELVNYELDMSDEGFHLNEFILDKDNWSEGYVTI
ncbi:MULTISPECIES: DUF7336 domain-containing protein [Deefgea]|uniref:Serine kinase n=1 Tax=Deefgea chitinilytica TaxID=570276 RepID=A0ABS2CEU9_9NEIS|nr:MULTISPECIES: hypothetical protein [Deefgea]MBM5572671.1 serine kinase [Deefgea chitinilytica]MBM9889907.1 serine kinase [Deefgea sp. CFH1-16]